MDGQIDRERYKDKKIEDRMIDVRPDRKRQSQREKERDKETERCSGKNERLKERGESEERGREIHIARERERERQCETERKICFFCEICCKIIVLVVFLAVQSNRYVLF